MTRCSVTTTTTRMPFFRSRSCLCFHKKSSSLTNIHTSFYGLYNHVQARVDSGLKRKPTNLSRLKSQSCQSLHQKPRLHPTLPRDPVIKEPLWPSTAFKVHTSKPRATTAKAMSSSSQQPFQSLKASQASRRTEVVKTPLKSCHKIAAELLTEARDEIQSLDQKVLALQQSLINDRQHGQQPRPSTSRGPVGKKKRQSITNGEEAPLQPRKSLDYVIEEQQSNGNKAVTKTTITSPSGGILFSTDVSRGLDRPHAVLGQRPQEVKSSGSSNGSSSSHEGVGQMPEQPASQESSSRKSDSDQQLQQQLRRANHRIVTYIDSLRKQVKEEQEKNDALAKQLQNEKNSTQNYQQLTRRIDELLRENEILQDSLNKCMTSAFNQIKDSSSSTTISATDSSMSQRTRALIEGLHQQLRVSQSRLEVVDSKRRGLEQQLHHESTSNMQLSEENERLKAQLEQLILSVTATSTLGQTSSPRIQEEQHHSLPPFSSHDQTADQVLKKRVIQMQGEREEVLREFTQMKNILEQIEVGMKESEEREDDEEDVQEELEGAVGGDDYYESDFEDQATSSAAPRNSTEEIEEELEEAVEEKDDYESDFEDHATSSTLRSNLRKITRV